MISRASVRQGAPVRRLIAWGVSFLVCMILVPGARAESCRIKRSESFRRNYAQAFNTVLPVYAEGTYSSRSSCQAAVNKAMIPGSNASDFTCECSASGGTTGSGSSTGNPATEMSNAVGQAVGDWVVGMLTGNSGNAQAQIEAQRRRQQEAERRRLEELQRQREFEIARDDLLASMKGGDGTSPSPPASGGLGLKPIPGSESASLGLKPPPAPASPPAPSRAGTATVAGLHLKPPPALGPAPQSAPTPAALGPALLDAEPVFELRDQAVDALRAEARRRLDQAMEEAESEGKSMLFGLGGPKEVYERVDQAAGLLSGYVDRLTTGAERSASEVAECLASPVECGAELSERIDAELRSFDRQVNDDFWSFFR